MKRISYDGRRFRPAESDVQNRVAYYWQDGDLLWGHFLGGKARRGALTGTCAEDGTLTFAYSMVLDDGAVVSGTCRSIPQLLPDGRIRLLETWERYGAHAGHGESVLEEIR